MEVNLIDSVHERALQQPERIAFEFLGKQTSYGEFDGAVARFAYALQEHGVKRGDHVALLVGNTPHFLVTMYAAWRIGAVVVPVNPIYTANEIAYIVQNSDATVMVALDQLFPLFQQRQVLFPKVETLIVCETDGASTKQCTQLEDRAYFFNDLMKMDGAVTELVDVDKDETAVILYTSGTSGQPKGAMLTHENVYSNARDIGVYLKMIPEDRVIATLPIFHVFALTVVVNAPLLKGATIILVPKFSPKEIFCIIREEKATVFAGVPTMYNFLYQYEEGTKEDYESIRLSISGGASLPVALLHNFEKKFDTRISEGYGLSEASPVTCFNPIDRERVPGSIGLSIVNVENKVVDHAGNEVPKGEVGELIVRGPNVMKGYYKMPEETAIALRDGWLYTGDMAREDEDGYFYIVDRKKDMIIVGGFNVYPREVEEVLYEHPEVVECAVIGVPDEDFGEQVQAYVVVKQGSDLNEEDLLAYCQQHLVKYKVPSVIHFSEELPKNATGKILRRSLRDRVVKRIEALREKRK